MSDTDENAGAVRDLGRDHGPRARYLVVARVGVGRSRATFERLRRYLRRVELVSVAKAVAAYLGEPGLEHELDLMGVRVSATQRQPEPPDRY